MGEVLLDAAGRRRSPARCRDSTPAVRHPTRDAAIRPTRRPSRRSSRSCVRSYAYFMTNIGVARRRALATTYRASLTPWRPGSMTHLAIGPTSANLSPSSQIGSGSPWRCEPPPATSDCSFRLRPGGYCSCLRLSHKSSPRSDRPFRRDRAASTNPRKPFDRVCGGRRFRSRRLRGLMRQPQKRGFLRSGADHAGAASSDPR
jgi:hypothetical protein